MKILHCCLACFYIDNYGYQENILPRYHKLMGHEVRIIASTESFDKNGCLTYIDAQRYLNEYGIEVIRLPYVNYIPDKVVKKLRRYKGLWEELNAFEPEFIFLHDIQFLDIDIIQKYAQTHTVKIVADCHTDFANSATNWFSKNILHKIIWRHCAHKIEPYVTKFYGVLPARVDFLKNVYKLPAEKCELLVMGADDELVEKAKTSGVRKKIRDKYKIAGDEILVVAGGKINHYRPEVLNLMEAIILLQNPGVKLLVFGNVAEKYKEKFDKLCKSDKIIYVGWLKSADTYEYFEAADLVVFPGLHSVMWEQAVAQGKAVVFRDIDGFHHVDVGGNALFVKDVSVYGLREALSELFDDENKIKKMTYVAEEKGIKVFSYADIARRSIQC